jgi:hypothetical protein
MSSDDDLEQLRRDVQYLVDRTAILDCIANHARGHDRHDVELMTSTYHEDGVDEHGFAINPGPAYGEWANKTHAAASETTTHNITTHTCEIDGDVAHCESYVLVGLLSPDEKTTTLIGGRYVDRLERRDGEWKLLVRRATAEWLFNADASFLHSRMFKAQGYVKGTRDKRDLSYERPLRIDTEPSQRW